MEDWRRRTHCWEMERTTRVRFAFFELRNDSHSGLARFYPLGSLQAILTGRQRAYARYCAFVKPIECSFRIRKMQSGQAEFIGFLVRLHNQ